MKLSPLWAGASLLASSALASDCQYIEGNYYCNQVNKVVYSGIGYSGSYQQVSYFNSTDCSCNQTPYAFSGTLTPLDEELSVHFRGPINLKQFAFYSVDSAAKKAKRDSPQKARRHVHHAHAHDKRDAVYVTATAYVTQIVYANVEAQNDPPSSSQNQQVVVTTVVQQAPSAAPVASSSSSAAPVVASSSAAPVVASSSAAPVVASSSAAPVVASSSAAPVVASSSAAPVVASSSAAPVVASSSAAPVVASSAQTTFSVASPSSSAATLSSSSAYVRSGYYSSSGSLDGLVFLNNMGGSAGSGVWDSCFGNSLSYAASDGVSGAGSSQVLSDVTLASNKEFSIWSSTECSGDSCGYYRPGSVAHHGFGGSTKIFAFEFSMPTDSSGGSSFNYDMPAVWLLNAQIPRNLQYGNSDCSCWSTGCGEMDLFEVLNAGNNRLTSHLHSGQGASSSKKARRDELFPHLNKRATAVVGGGGGTADYIARPTSGTLKAAAVFQDGAITIVVLPDDTTFDANLDEDTVAEWLASNSDSAANVVL